MCIRDSAGLFAPIALMLLWRFRTVRYTIDGVFRLAFPLIVVALGALPFAYGTPLVVAAALLYMIYSFLSLSVQILAVQVSHDYGIDPVFCLSFQTLVCVAAQGLGYLLGALAPCGTAFDVSPYAVIALGSVDVYKRQGEGRTPLKRGGTRITATGRWPPK